MGKMPQDKSLWHAVISLCVSNLFKMQKRSSLFELQKGFWLTPHENMIINSSCIYCWRIINNRVPRSLAYVRILLLFETRCLVPKWHTYFSRAELHTERNFFCSVGFLLLARGGGKQAVGVLASYAPADCFQCNFYPFAAGVLYLKFLSDTVIQIMIILINNAIK